MHDAAVGFQCPNCIAEGAKTTRSARTPYGGTRSGNPALSSMVLIGVNIAVWLTIVATGWRESRLIDRLALLPVGRCGSEASPGAYYNLAREQTCERATDGDGIWFPGVSDGSYWQLVTSGFAHVEVWHIGFNMVALWFLGPQLEAVLGRTRFLALYFISLLAGSALVYWLADEGSATLGASGAIFGLLGALMIVAYKVGGDVRGLMVWLGLNVAITFLFPNVSWQGHLGGFVGGFLVGAVLVYAPRDRRTPIQAVGLSVITIVALALVVTRTAVLA
jgi:membrane associated rhomboid family serine protease